MRKKEGAVVPARMRPAKYIFSRSLISLQFRVEVLKRLIASVLRLTRHTRFW